MHALSKQTLFIENVNKMIGIAGDQQLQLFYCVNTSICNLYFEINKFFPEGSSDEYLWTSFSCV